MSWLDGMTGCKEQCNLAGAKMTMSNFKLDSLDKPAMFKCQDSACVQSTTGVALSTCNLNCVDSAKYKCQQDQCV